MAYRNDRTERARLQKLWIDTEDRPCAICGSRDRREIGHITPYCDNPVTNESTCQVECFTCNRTKEKSRKFRVGDKVRIKRNLIPKHDIPNWLDFDDYDRSRPRTIVYACYDRFKQCMLYTLGSNGKGKLANDGQPLDGLKLYQFRSYQLETYHPRRYGKRRYSIKPDDSRLTGRIVPATTG